MKIVQLRPRATATADAEHDGDAPAPEDNKASNPLTEAARAITEHVIKAVDETLHAAEAFRPPRLSVAKLKRPRRRLSPAGVLARALEPAYSPRRPSSQARDALAMLMRFVDRPAEVAKRVEVPDTIAAAPPAEAQPAPALVDTGFWPIWIAHRDHLLRTCLRFSNGNLADAEDALSEAMLKAVQAFPNAVIRNHRAWLVRLAHNVCMDRHRSDQRLHRLMSDIGRDGGRPVPAVVPNSHRSPEDLLAALQLLQDLQQALATLPQSLSEPLRLYLDERSDAEIASSLNVTKEVVRKRRQMARDWLKRQMLCR